MPRYDSTWSYENENSYGEGQQATKHQRHQAARYTRLTSCEDPAIVEGMDASWRAGSRITIRRMERVPRLMSGANIAPPVGVGASWLVCPRHRNFVFVRHSSQSRHSRSYRMVGALLRNCRGDPRNREASRDEPLWVLLLGGLVSIASESRRSCTPFSHSPSRWCGSRLVAHDHWRTWHLRRDSAETSRTSMGLDYRIRRSEPRRGLFALLAPRSRSPQSWV